MIGSSEILIIAVVVLVLFGASAIPKFGRALGRFKKEVEEGIHEGEKDTTSEKTDNQP